MYHFTLTQLTVLALPPTETIKVAARYGYGSVGIRILPVTADGPAWPLITDRAMREETKRVMADTGVFIHEVEMVRLAPDTDPKSYEAYFATAADLGVKWSVAVPFDPDFARATANLAAMCDLAAQYGMGVSMEFFPYAPVNNLQKARAIVEGTGKDNAAILVDTIHMDRCLNTGADVDGIPAFRLPFMQICDAPAERPTTTEELVFQSRVERLPPGEGGIDIKGIMAHMPKNIPIGLEVPMTAKANAEGLEAVAKHVIEATRRYLGE